MIFPLLEAAKRNMIEIIKTKVIVNVTKDVWLMNFDIALYFLFFDILYLNLTKAEINNTTIEAIHETINNKKYGSMIDKLEFIIKSIIIDEINKLNPNHISLFMPFIKE